MSWLELLVVIEAGVIFCLYRKIVQMDEGLDLILKHHHTKIGEIECQLLSFMSSEEHKAD